MSEILGSNGDFGDDLRDLSKFRMPPDSDAVAPKRVIRRVDVEIPKEHWFRIRGGPEFTFGPCKLVQIKKDRKLYLFSQEMADAFPEHGSRYWLRVGQTQDQQPFLCPLRIVDSDNSWADHYRALYDVSVSAETKWQWLKWNGSAYDNREDSTLADPKWGELFDLLPLMKVAFKGRVINSEDHPGLRYLEGRGDVVGS